MRVSPLSQVFPSRNTLDGGDQETQNPVFGDGGFFTEAELRNPIRNKDKLILLLSSFISIFVRQKHPLEASNFSKETGWGNEGAV